MDKFSSIITLLVSVLGVMPIIMPFVIEFIKSMVGQNKIVSIFGNLERFSAIATAIVSVVIYILLHIFLPESFMALNLIQKIATGFVFTFANAMASQIGYDKIIKWIINRGK